MRKTIVAATAALLALTGTISAQDWPSRPITMIIPFAPGGGVDASGRIQAQRMGELLGQTIVVENVGAAAGTVGSLRVAQGAPDGYTFLMGNSGTHAYSQGLRKNPPYNSVTDFAPVGLVTESPRILLARKDLPVNNLQEFVAYVKANQAKMQFGSAGVGSGTHLPCELLNATIGVKVTHIPYKGAGSGDAGPDRRPHRLHVRHHPDRRGAGQGGNREGHRGDVAAARADHRRACRPPASRAWRASRRRCGTASSSRRARPTRSCAG